jgi:acetate kinase
MAKDILCLNAGSSSLKFALFEIGADGALALALSGAIEGIGTQPRLHAADAAGRELVRRVWDDGAALTHESFLSDVIGWVEENRGADRILGAGHRIVHGGAAFIRPVLIDDRVLAGLDRLVPLAPLHQPHNLAVIRALQAIRPDLPQVGCFDTAFHAHMPQVAAQFALPLEFAAEGIRRYGFHGLSYEYIAGQLPRVAPEIAAGKVVIAHLGNGASLCAIAGGESVDTTMSFTPLDGLPMGTRCGALDPGVVLYLLRQRHMDAAAVEDLLYRRSGLLGLSGVSSDMAVLLASTAKQAAAAIDLFVYRVLRELGALAAALGGLDGLVFTAGIGEHAAVIRERICVGAA